MNITRRGFLGTMIGGVVAAVAAQEFPFRVFSFPSEISIAKPVTLRFIRNFDPFRMAMVNRWDVLAGHEVEVPKALDFASIVKTSSNQIAEGWKVMGARTFLGRPLVSHIPPAPLSVGQFTEYEDRV